MFYVHVLNIMISGASAQTAQEIHSIVSDVLIWHLAESKYQIGGAMHSLGAWLSEHSLRFYRPAHTSKTFTYFYDKWIHAKILAILQTCIRLSDFSQKYLKWICTNRIVDNKVHYTIKNVPMFIAISVRTRHKNRMKAWTAALKFTSWQCFYLKMIQKMW